MSRDSVPGYINFAFTSMSVAMGTTLTHPLDLIKVRLQIERSKATLAPFSFRIMGQTALNVWKSFGFKAFFSGLNAALVRSVVFGGTRFGLFLPVRNSLKNFFPTRSNGIIDGLSALGTGSFAALFGNPLEVIKVRMQASATRYPNLHKALHSMISSEGFLSLWHGYTLSASRAALLTCSQILPYQQAKKFLAARGFPSEGLTNQLVSSLAAGLVTTTITSPIDVIKTRVMNKKDQSTTQFIKQLLQQEGPKAFMRGWMPNYVRLGPLTLFIFVFYENLLRFSGYKDF